ncbi:hypothetical protein HA402_013638 [Bradysia odoriphaga]|nr:hypothetical protein HA402_013638 [Bradysia odoriphaga]
MKIIMVALKKKKESYIHLQRSKTNLRQSNLKRFKVSNGSSPLKFQAPLSLVVDSVADGEVTKIFKNDLYGNKSTMSLDLSNDSEENIWNKPRDLIKDVHCTSNRMNPLWKVQKYRRNIIRRETFFR